MIISLMGYMGSGKSHISRILDEKTNYKIIDLDVEIISRYGLSVSEIFKKKGEIFFRKLERDVLEDILTTKKNIVLSLGGGTPAYYDNITLINEYSISFFLQTSVSVLVKRLVKDKEKRPLISNISDKDLPEFIAKHLFERNTFYHQAKFTINTNGKTPEEIATEIISIIKI